MKQRVSTGPDGHTVLRLFRILMVRAALVTVGAAVEVAPAVAQHPDLSGTWRLDKEESHIPDDGRTDGMRTFIPPTFVVITQRGDTVRAEYRAWDDSRGMRSPADYRHRSFLVGAPALPLDADDTSRTVVARWKGRTLVVEITRTTSHVVRSTTETTRETYKLIAEGRKLAVQTWYPKDAPDGPPRARLVYTRSK